jgi:hypothetical protein
MQVHHSFIGEKREMAIEIIDTKAENILQYGLCGYKDIKRAGYPEKLKWLKDRFPEGLKIKTLYSDKERWNPGYD